MFQRIDGCRACGHPDLETVLDLGEQPLADALLRPEDLARPEPRYPLTVVFCPGCALPQLRETVAPEELFCRDYPYYSSFSPALLEHTRRNVAEIAEHRSLGPSSQVIELASNDGYLLQYYAERGIPVLGIDPAEGPAQAAVERGIPTLCTFFDVALARRLREEGQRADVIHANNVLAHVPDLNGFVEGIGTLLRDEGIAVIEVPHVQELIAHCEFDTIYHEHLCYFSVTALRRLFASHGLVLNDVRGLPIHGGSLRLTVSHVPGERPSVEQFLSAEREAGLDRADGYRDFGKRVEELRSSLLELLTRLKREGAHIAAYGAAAKGSTLINYVGIGRELVDFVVDRNVHKHGRLMPGQHLPVFGPEHLVSERPDYTLLLAWNFQDEILEQQEAYRRLGGRFISPVPEPRVL